MIHALTPQQQVEQAIILESGSGVRAFQFARDTPGADTKALEQRVLAVGNGHEAFMFAKNIPGANVCDLYNRALEVGDLDDEDDIMDDFERLADLADLLAEGASFRQSGAMLNLSREQLLALSKTQDPDLQELAKEAGAALDVTGDQRVIFALAKGQHKDGEIEIDDSAAIAGTGPDGDNGAFVSAWLWVDFAGTPLDKSGEAGDSDEEVEVEGDAP
ncbi:MAG: hypothetical protein K2W33_15020 [Burkholderiales bacterium]|nr:hypothetical protein [Burkholderiales bacterium]